MRGIIAQLNLPANWEEWKRDDKIAHLKKCELTIIREKHLPSFVNVIKTDGNWSLFEIKIDGKGTKYSKVLVHRDFNGKISMVSL